MVRVNAERPCIELDGVRYFTCWRVAKLCEKLWKARGQIVSYENLGTAMNTNKTVVQVYAHHLRVILRNHDLDIATELETGYRMTGPKGTFQ